MYVIGCKFSLTRQSMKRDIIVDVELMYLRLSVASLQIREQGGWLQIDKIDLIFIHIRYKHPMAYV